MYRKFCGAYSFAWTWTVEWALGWAKHWRREGKVLASPPPWFLFCTIFGSSSTRGCQRTEIKFYFLLFLCSRAFIRTLCWKKTFWTKTSLFSGCVSLKGVLSESFLCFNFTLLLFFSERRQPSFVSDLASRACHILCGWLGSGYQLISCHEIKSIPVCAGNQHRVKVHNQQHEAGALRIARTTLGYTVCKVTYALKKSHEGCESGVDPCPLDNFGSGFTERER